MKCPKCEHDMIKSRAGWLCPSCGHIEPANDVMPPIPGNSPADQSAADTQPDTEAQPLPKTEEPPPPPPTMKAPWETLDTPATPATPGPSAAASTTASDDATPTAPADHFQAVEQATPVGVSGEMKDTDLMAVDQALAAVPDKLPPVDEAPAVEPAATETAPAPAASEPTPPASAESTSSEPTPDVTTSEPAPVATDANPSAPIVEELAAVSSAKEPADTIQEATDEPKLEHSTAKIHHAHKPKSRLHPKKADDHHAGEAPASTRRHTDITANTSSETAPQPETPASDSTSRVATQPAQPQPAEAQPAESHPAEPQSVERPKGIEARAVHQIVSTPRAYADSFDGPTPAAALAGKSHIQLTPSSQASAEPTPGAPVTEPAEAASATSVEAAPAEQPDETASALAQSGDTATAEAANEPATEATTTPEADQAATPSEEPAAPIEATSPESTSAETASNETAPAEPTTSEEPATSSEPAPQPVTGLGPTGEPVPAPANDLPAVPAIPGLAGADAPTPEAELPAAEPASGPAPDPTPETAPVDAPATPEAASEATPSSTPEMPAVPELPTQAPVANAAAAAAAAPETAPAPAPAPAVAATAPATPGEAKPPLTPVTHPKPLDRKVLITSIIAGAVMILAAVTAYFVAFASSGTVESTSTPTPHVSSSPQVNGASTTPTPAGQSQSAAQRDAQRKADLAAYVQAYRATVTNGYYSTTPPAITLSVNDPSTNQPYQISSAVGTALGTISYRAGHQCSGADVVPGKASTHYVALTIKLETEADPYCLNINN